jgi:hypothetical protein
VSAAELIRVKTSVTRSPAQCASRMQIVHSFDLSLHDRVQSYFTGISTLRRGGAASCVQIIALGSADIGLVTLIFCLETSGEELNIV